MNPPLIICVLSGVLDRHHGLVSVFVFVFVFLNSCVSGVLDRHPRLVWLLCLPPSDGLLCSQTQAKNGQIRNPYQRSKEEGWWDKNPSVQGEKLDLGLFWRLCFEHNINFNSRLRNPAPHGI